MTPTRPGVLAATAALAGLLTYLLASAAYDDLPQVPVAAAVSLVLLAVVEGCAAKVVGDRLRGRRDAAGRPLGRPLHPEQVARAAVLAKASSAAAALFAGLYAGLLAWVLPRRDEVLAYADDARAAGASALAALLLVAAALVLERACLAPPAPPVPDDPP